jgi:hypothetical protein
MRPVESHEAVEERQLREWGVKINSIREQAYSQGFEDGIKTTAIMYPISKTGKQKVIILNAANAVITTTYGEIEDIKEANNKIYIYMYGRQPLDLIVDKKEEK